MSENIINYQPEDFDRLLLAARARAIQALEAVTASKDERNALRAIMIIFRVPFPTDLPELSTPEDFDEYKRILNKARYIALLRADEFSTTSADEVVKTRASQAITRLQTSEERLLRGCERKAKSEKKAATAAQGAKKIADIAKRSEITFGEAVEDYISLQEPGQRALYAKKLGQKFGDPFARKVIKHGKEIIASRRD
jgi:hypothetical protein